jgi:protein-tyrosine phosphatase
VIDIHNHLLVNLDDGSRSLTRSRKVLEVFRDRGVTAVVCTPHLAASQIADQGENRITERDRALAMLRDVSPLPLSPGMEIMLDEPLSALVAGDRRYALAGSRYYLVEFPSNVAPDLTTKVLAQILAAGIVPVVAHPERYGDCTVQTVHAWKAAGAAVQVDATTLTRATDRGQRARAIVAGGLADVLAADNHGDNRGLWVARDWLARQRGDAGQVATLLCVDNPRRIVADEPLAPAPPIDVQVSLLQRLRETWS